MPSIVHAVAKRRRYGAVVDKKGRHFHAVRLINNAFTDVGCNDLDTIRWKLFVDVSPDVNIEGERFL